MSTFIWFIGCTEAAFVVYDNNEQDININAIWEQINFLKVDFEKCRCIFWEKTVNIKFK